MSILKFSLTVMVGLLLGFSAMAKLTGNPNTQGIGNAKGLRDCPNGECFQNVVESPGAVELEQYTNGPIDDLTGLPIVNAANTKPGSGNSNE